MTHPDLITYRKHLDAFDLTDQQKLELVGSIRCITEKLLDKKYGLNQQDYPRAKMPDPKNKK